jgi:hypothetical protein
MPDDLGTPVGPPSVGGEGGGGPQGRSPDEIALDLMRFVAVTTGYGRSGGSTAGFSGKPTARSAEEYAEALLQLFERCREVVKKGK